MNYLSILFLFLLILISCTPKEEVEPDEYFTGLKPIYGNVEDLRKISVGDTLPMINPGRIVYLAPRLFVNEIDKGIHVINNLDPSNPVKESFIHIPFNKDLAVKNDIIYADNDQDLVAIRYYSADSISVISRQEKIFDRLPAFPINYSGYFECVDENRGIVVGWEEAELLNPKCRTF